jgi:hypothetical protein
MTTHKNAPLTGEVKQGAYQTDHNFHDTSTSAQRQRLLEWLIHNGSINTHFARDRLNIMAPAARIKELRDKGHNIHTDRITLNDRDGRSHPRVACYVLLQLAEVQS